MAENTPPVPDGAEAGRSTGTETPVAAVGGDGVVGPPSEATDKGYHGDDAADHGYEGRPEDKAPFGADFGKGAVPAAAKAVK